MMGPLIHLDLFVVMDFTHLWHQVDIIHVLHVQMEHTLMRTIQHNEYRNEEMERKQEMKHVMMAIHLQTMVEIQTDQKLKTLGHALEVLRLHKTIVYFI